MRVELGHFVGSHFSIYSTLHSNNKHDMSAEDTRCVTGQCFDVMERISCEEGYDVADMGVSLTQSLTTELAQLGDRPIWIGCGLYLPAHVHVRLPAIIAAMYKIPGNTAHHYLISSVHSQLLSSDSYSKMSVHRS